MTPLAAAFMNALRSDISSSVGLAKVCSVAPKLWVMTSARWWSIT